MVEYSYISLFLLFLEVIVTHQLFFIAGVVLYFLYHIILLDFCTKILKGGVKNRLLHFVVSLINVSAVFIFLIDGIPVFVPYIIVFLILMLEFKIISTAGYRQLLFASTAVTMHATLTHIVVYNCMAAYYNSSVEEIFSNHEARASSLFFLCTLLIVFLLVFKKFIPVESCYRISTANVYSEFISLFATILSVLYLIGNEFLMSEPYSYRILLINILSMITITLIYYYTFLYVLSFVNMRVFKRESDKIESEYKATLHKKELIIDKVIRDSLTGLYNKKFITSTLETLCETDALDFSLIFIDINGLKYVNDNFGHDIGDELIQCVASTIKISLRDEDFAARLSGDEFLVVVANTNSQGNESIINRISTYLKQEDTLKPYTVSAGMGIINVTQELKNQGVTAMLELADEKMREDKKKYYERANL